MGLPRRGTVAGLVVVTIVGCAGIEATSPRSYPSAPPTVIPAETAEASATAPPGVATTSSTTAIPGGGGRDRGSDLVGRWAVTAYSGVSGQLRSVVGDRPVYLEFAADGGLVFHTGCNAGNGGYTTTGGYHPAPSGSDETPEGQALQFHDLFIEQVGCSGALGEQDRDLPARLLDVTRFVLEGGRLRLFGDRLLVEATPSG